eukprot:scaffold24418_cov107-Isochrysis_galbana.AAC.1
MSTCHGSKGSIRVWRPPQPCAPVAVHDRAGHLHPPPPSPPCLRWEHDRPAAGSVTRRARGWGAERTCCFVDSII